MYKLVAIVLFLAANVSCQIQRDDTGSPTRYVLPYSGLASEDQSEEQQYYKPNRRSERIPATAYQYDEAISDEDYYRPQPRQKEEQGNYRYQSSTPSHKDYEEILKHNHLARLRVAAKKQREPQRQPLREPQREREPQSQPAVEQYLKEVNPTTKTAYQRPSNYLRFSGQSAELKQEQSEETQAAAVKQQPYRYVLQPELQQQKAIPQFQYESQEHSIKAEPQSKAAPPFNLIAYQNALIAQQKLVTGEAQEDATPKSSIYVSQNIAKKPSNKKQKGRPAPLAQQQYEYYPQVPPQPQAYSSETSRYQSQLSRNLYQKSEPAYQTEDPLLYPETKEIEYQTQSPLRQTKQRTTRIPKRKPAAYSTEEPSEDYQQEGQSFEYQEEQPLSYRRPSTRPTPKSLKYSQPALEENSDAAEQIPADGYLQYQIPKYQQEASVPRRPQLQYQREPEARQQIPSRSEQVIPRKASPFNIVAYEKALKEQEKLLEAERRLLEKEKQTTTPPTPNTTRRTTKKPKYETTEPSELQLDYPEEVPVVFERPISKPKFAPIPNVFHRRHYNAFHQRDLTSQGSSNIPLIYHDGSFSSDDLAHHRNVRAVIIVVD